MRFLYTYTHSGPPQFRVETINYEIFEPGIIDIFLWKNGQNPPSMQWQFTFTEPGPGEQNINNLNIRLEEEPDIPGEYYWENDGGVEINWRPLGS